MKRRPGRPLCLVFLVALVWQAGLVRADDTENREYSIFVDGKDAGKSMVRMVQKDDGTTYVLCNAEVKVKKLFGSFSYKVEAQEWWKDGRLIGLKSNSEEDGKKTEVVVSPDAGQLRVVVNGQAHKAPPDVWTSSYWKLADAKYHNKPLAILDVDTGKEYAGQLKYVGTEQRKLGSQLQDCYHFHVAGTPYPVELWFDRYHRLVRQEFTEKGFRTIIQLEAVRR